MKTSPINGNRTQLCLQNLTKHWIVFRNLLTLHGSGTRIHVMNKKNAETRSCTDEYNNLTMIDVKGLDCDFWSCESNLAFECGLIYCQICLDGGLPF